MEKKIELSYWPYNVTYKLEPNQLSQYTLEIALHWDTNKWFYDYEYSLRMLLLPLAWFVNR